MPMIWDIVVLTWRQYDNQSVFLTYLEIVYHIKVFVRIVCTYRHLISQATMIYNRQFIEFLTERAYLSNGHVFIDCSAVEGTQNLHISLYQQYSACAQHRERVIRNQDKLIFIFIQGQWWNFWTGRGQTLNLKLFDLKIRIPLYLDCPPD